MSTEPAKFWSDDFDMDLLKLFPDLATELSATANVPIWTLSRTTHGRLNCPAAWNSDYGLMSLLWLEKPNLPRSEYGWVNVGGCVCKDTEVEGTWMEWLRDMWVHAHYFTVLPHGPSFKPPNQQMFDKIMYHRRGWHQCDQIDVWMNRARRWVLATNYKFAGAVEAFSLGKIDRPYFAAGSVPEVKEVA